MDAAQFNGIEIDKLSFKKEFAKLIQTSPTEAAAVAFGLLQKATRFERELKEVSDSWHRSTDEIKALKIALRKSKKLAEDQAATSEETTRDLMLQLEAFEQGRELSKAKDVQLKEERLKVKKLEKEMKEKNRKIAALEKDVIREKKKAEKVPKLIENIQKLNKRKKELIQEKKFEVSRKKLYLEENRILKEEARENEFKVYKCNYHKEERTLSTKAQFVNFKNQFFN